MGSDRVELGAPVRASYLRLSSRAGNRGADDPSRPISRFAHLKVLNRALRETLAQYLSAKSNLRVLDLGCGRMPYRWLVEPHAAWYLGADLPSNSLADLNVDEAGRTALPDECCDLVLSTQVLEHTYDPSAYLRETFRVLTPGGNLILSTHGYWVLHPDPEDYWRWTRNGLILTVERSGFEVVSVRGVMGVAATSLQLLQDSLRYKLPAGFRHLFLVGCQVGILLLDALQSQESKDQDACVFVIRAQKPVQENPAAGQSQWPGTDLQLSPITGLRPAGDRQDPSELRVAADGPSPPHVAVLCPNRDQYSETFIRTHIERLPGKVMVYYGAWLPCRQDGGRELAGLHWRLVKSALRAVGKSPSWVDERLLLQSMRRAGVQVALAEYGPTGVSVMRACRRFSIPLVVHFHGFDAYDQETLETYGKRYQELFEIAAAVIVVSHDMEKQLLGLGVPPRKLFLIPYGVDTEVFAGADPAQSRPIFLAVGRFVDKKAPHLTLLAFADVLKRCPDARLTLVGDGPLLESCVQISEALRIARAVDFSGVMKPLDVSLAMRRARAFVQHSVVTSYGDSEGTPVAAIEAASSGLPIVATRHRGLADVVLDKQTGFLVNEGDIRSMSERMLTLALDAELAGQLGRHGRAHAVKHYSVGDRIRQLGDVLMRAAQSNGIL